MLIPPTTTETKICTVAETQHNKPSSALRVVRYKSQLQSYLSKCQNRGKQQATSLCSASYVHYQRGTAHIHLPHVTAAEWKPHSNRSISPVSYCHWTNSSKATAAGLLQLAHDGTQRWTDTQRDGWIPCHYIDPALYTKWWLQINNNNNNNKRIYIAP